MSLSTDLPTDKVDGGLGHTSVHNTTNARVNDVAFAVNTHDALLAGAPITPESRGAAGSYSAAVDDAAYVTAALTAGKAAGRDVLLLRRYRLTSGITWDPSAHGIAGVGAAQLDFSPMLSGTALTITSATGPGVNFDQIRHALAGVTITGPTADATTVDGIVFVGAGTNNAAVNLTRLRVIGFRDQLTIGDNQWATSVDRCTFEGFKRRGLSYTPSSTAGENLAFRGCVWQNGANLAGTATAVYVPTSFTPEGNLNFVNCSFDYSNLEFDVNSGIVNLVDCHIEDDGTGEMVRTSAGSTSGQNELFWHMAGGRIYLRNAAPDRPYLHLHTAGDRAKLVYAGVKIGAGTGGTARQYDLVRVSSGSPQVEVARCYIPRTTTDNSKQVLPGPRANLLYNGDWELGATTGWTLTGSVTTVSVQSTTKRNGTYALSIVGTGVAGQRAITQKFPVSPGQVAVTRTSVQAESMTGGALNLYIRAYAADGTTTITSDLVAVTANASFAEVYRWWAVPAGTAYVEYRLSADNLSGTVYVDDCYLALV